MIKMQPIIESVEEVVDKIGVKYVAAEFGHSRQYIEKIINPLPDPEDKKHFPLEYFIRIMQMANDFTPLSVLAMQCGFTLMPATSKPDGENMQDECLQAWDAASEFLNQASKGENDIHKMTKLFESMNKEAQDVLHRIVHQ